MRFCRTSRHASSWSPFALPFRIRQPLRHLLVVGAVPCPTLRGAVPAVVLDGHVDAAIDQETHRLVVLSEHQLVQQTRRLVRAPVGIDVRAACEEEFASYVERSSVKSEPQHAHRCANGHELAVVTTR